MDASSAHKRGPDGSPQQWFSARGDVSPQRAFGGNVFSSLQLRAIHPVVKPSGCWTSYNGRTAPNKGLSIFNANSVKAGNRKEVEEQRKSATFRPLGIGSLWNFPSDGLNCFSKLERSCSESVNGEWIGWLMWEKRMRNGHLGKMWECDGFWKSSDFHAALKTRAFGTWLRSEMPSRQKVMCTCLRPCLDARVQAWRRRTVFNQDFGLSTQLWSRKVQRSRDVKKQAFLIAGHRI